MAFDSLQLLKLYFMRSETYILPYTKGRIARTRLRFVSEQPDVQIGPEDRNNYMAIGPLDLRQASLLAPAQSHWGDSQLAG
jgi:hypothetical protein